MKNGCYYNRLANYILVKLSIFSISAKVIGEDSKVTIGAVVTQDIPKGNKVSGNFAIDHEYFCFMVNP